MNKNITKDREYWIDAVRSFACICVITTHAPIPNDSPGQSFVAISNYFAVAGASILFFMISGALVLYREQSFVPFMKKRISRIALPMIIWSSISLVIAYLMGDMSISEMGKRILMIPFYPQVGSYWFIYVIFGIYLITPILSSWLSHCKKSELEIYLGIWGFTLVLPYLFLMNDELKRIFGHASGYLYYFYGFVGFAVLGYYLRKYVNLKEIRFYYLFVLLVLLLPCLLYLWSAIPHTIIQNRMSINIVLLSACYFLIIKSLRISQIWCIIFYDFAQHSFGIYLVHFLIMRRFLWPLLEGYQVNYIIQIPLIVTLTALISYCVVHLISKLPFSKYIVGL